MTSELRFIIDGQHLERIDNNIISSGSVAVPVAIFENMRNVWSDYSVYNAEFTQGEVTIKVPLLGTNMCFVPPEVLGEGYMTVSVYAETEEGNVITTDTVDVEIKRGPSKIGDNSVEITPSDKALIQAAVERAIATANSVREDANAGIFNGADGKDGMPGADGKDGASFEVFSDLDSLKQYPTTTTATVVRFVWAGEDKTEYSNNILGSVVLNKHGIYDAVIVIKAAGHKYFENITEVIVLSGDVDEDSIKQIVDNYLAEKPIEGGMTEEQAAQLAENTKDISDLQNNKADKDEIPSVPTKLSDLENDKEFIDKTVDDLANYYLKDETYTREEVKSLLSAIPKFSIQPVDELPTEDISTTTVYLLKYGEDAQDLYQEYIYVNGNWEYLGSQKVDLSGYALKTDIPTTASDIGAVTDDEVKAYINTHNSSPGAHSAIRGEISKLQENKADKTEIPTVPTDISAFDNDTGYITKAVSDLLNYYTKSESYTKDEINNLVSSIPKFSISVVSTLPTLDISTTTIYLKSGGSGDDLYTEYIYVNDKWEILGSQRVDLTGYATEDWVNVQLDSYLKQTALTEAINTALAQAKASGEFDGTDGHTPVKGVDYFTPDEIADIKADLSKIEAPAIVSSVDEMTDTTKHYVLDGYIYSSRTVVTEGETIITYPNQLDPDTVLRNTRLSGSSGSTSTRTGYFVTDFIKVNDSGFATASSYNVRLNWELPLAAATDCRVVYYNTTERSSTARVGDRTISSTNTTVGDGVTTIDLLKGSGTNPPTASEVVYVSLELAIDSSLASLANFDFTNYQITFDAIYDSETTEDTETQQWVNSGISYTPTFKTDLIGVMGEGNVIYVSDNSLPSGTYILKADNANYDTIGEYIVE